MMALKWEAPPNSEEYARKGRDTQLDMAGWKQLEKGTGQGAILIMRAVPCGKINAGQHDIGWVVLTT